jgi:Protein of unknown function (DUF3987)
MIFQKKNKLAEAEKDAKEQASANQDRFTFDFPISSFPHQFQDIIRGKTDSTDLHPDFFSICMLSFFGLAAGNTIQVRTPFGQRIKPNFQACMVGISGEGKSPILSFFMQPFENLDKKADILYTEKLREYERICKEDKDHVWTPKPLPGYYTTSDATPEAIYKLCKANRRGVVYYKDEFRDFIKAMDKYGKGSNEGFYMSLMDGANAAINRAGKDKRDFVENPFFIVVGGFTPDFLEDLAKTKMDMTGFLNRLNYAYPDLKPLNPYPSTPDDPKWQQLYRDKLQKILDFDFNDVENSEPHVLEYDIEAYNILKEYYDRRRSYANQVLNATNETRVRSLRKKMETNSHRMALIIELMYFSVGESDLSRITARSARAAVEFDKYFERAAFKTYAEIRRYKELLEKPDHRGRYKINWAQIFKEDKVLETTELSKRVFELYKPIYPTLSRSTLFEYFNSQLKSAGHGKWKLTEEQIKGNEESQS